MNHFFTGFVDELTKTAAKGSVRAALSKISPGVKDALKSMGLWSAIDYGLAPEQGVSHALRSGAGFVGGDILAGKLLGGAGGAGLKGKGLRFGGRMIGGMLGASYLHNLARKKKGDYDRASREKTAAAVPKSHLTPDSSNVKGFSYDPSTKQLSVTYKGGGTYRYNDVPPATFRSLRRNKSAGKTINRLVKAPGYDYEKVGKVTVKVETTEPGNPIPVVTHEFSGKTEDEARGYMASHRKTDKFFDACFDGNMGKIECKNSKVTVIKTAGKSYTCKVCGKPATTGQIWAEGRAIATHCDDPKCKAATLNKIGEKPIAERDLTKQANGDMLAYYAAHPAKAKEKQARDVVRLKKRRAAGKYLTDNQKALLKKEGSPKHPTAQEKFYASTTQSPYYAKKEREKRKQQEANRLLKKAGFLRERVREGNSTELIGSLRKKRRQIEKMAGVCVRTLTWGGLTMKFEYLKGDIRSGTGEGGKKWSRKMKDCYGYIPGTYGKGADGEAIDVYFNPDALDGPVFKIRQLTKEGKYDEDKFMVGYGSAATARAAFARNMPKWAFGDMTSMTMKSFRTLVGQEGREVRVPSDGNAERERVRRAMERKSA